MSRKGVWTLQDVRDKYLSSLWIDSYSCWGWGQNNEGEAGTPSWGIQRSSPVQVTDTPDFADIVKMGSNGSGGAIIRDSGALHSWGKNQYGNLGHGDRSDRNGAYVIPGTKDWTDVSNCSVLYGDNQIATRQDGTLWTWGNNNYGQLGVNYRTLRSSPVQIGTETTWGGMKSAATGQYYSGAIKSDGTLWMWGRNDQNGQLGQGNQTHYSSPVQIPGTSWDQIVIGTNTVHATRTDGTLWAWGSNYDGRLGTNNNNQYSSPYQIPGTDWKTGERGVIAANVSVAAAVRTDSTLWIWGQNGAGRLGLNQPSAPTSYSSPKQIPGSWSKVFGGVYSMFAIQTDGSLWSWGRNNKGQLGQNDVSSPANSGYSSPKQIGTETDWHLASGIFQYATCGLRANLTPAQK